MPPLEPGMAQSNRRKLKMRAIQARFAFTSTCIETWGLYTFMEKLEKHPEMFWLGGQPGRFSREARKHDGPGAYDLAVLREKSQKRYDATLENALDPDKVDGRLRILKFASLPGVHRSVEPGS